jgi:hypothetical protein
MRRAIALVLLPGVLVGATPPAAHAQIYRYVDDGGQTHYVDGADSVPERFRGAAVPIGLRNAPAPPPGSQPAAPKAGGPTVIKYTPGQRIMVDVRINGGFTTRLLLDTGADRTMISPRALQAAGVSITRPVASGQITGATGSDRIDYVVVESLEVGDARVGRLPVGAYELSGAGAGDGLLGRDFLDQFKVTMDATSGEVHLAPK